MPVPNTATSNTATIDDLLKSVLASYSKVADNSGVTGVRVSGGSSSPHSIDDITDIIETMLGTHKAQKAVMQGAQQAQDLLTVQQQTALQQGSVANANAATAASDIATQKGNAALEVQTKNQQLVRSTNADEVFKGAIDDINLASERRKNLLDAADAANTNSQLHNVLFGDTTFRQYLDANFVNTPEDYTARATAQAQIMDTAAHQIRDINDVYTGAQERNTATAQNITQATVAAGATLQANEYVQKANDQQIQALIAGSQNLQRVVQDAEHESTIATTAAHMELLAEGQKRMEDRFGLGLAGKDPESFAAAVRLGGKFLGSAGISNVQGKDIKELLANPKTKDLLTRAYMVGNGLSGAAALGANSETPNLLGTAGESAVILKDTRGTLPNGMGRTQQLLQGLESGTDYIVQNGIAGRPAKPEEKIAAINQNANNWYAANAKDIDGTTAYGQPPIKTIATFASMNTDPDVAGWNKTILQPIAAGVDTAPANTIIKATLAQVNAGTMPLNVAVKGITAYAKTVQAAADATSRYQVVGLKRASEIPYTANLTSEGGILGGGIKSINIGDETAVRNYLFRQQQVHKLYNQGVGPTLTGAK